MRRITFLAAILTMTFAAKAQEVDFGWDRKVSNVKAAVQFLSGDKETVIIIPDSNPNMRYMSKQLPEEYKKEGLKVTFTGWLGKIPPNVRMVATPLKITKICISKEEAKKHGIKKTSYAFKE